MGNEHRTSKEKPNAGSMLLGKVIPNYCSCMCHLNWVTMIVYSHLHIITKNLAGGLFRLIIPVT